ncbi:MAG TPA: hypothetical protein VFF19_23305, partial [Reyranella sp.]|nr:hypothetical protein [Reyranella sp.]
QTDTGGLSVVWRSDFPLLQAAVSDPYLSVDNPLDFRSCQRSWMIAWAGSCLEFSMSVSAKAFQAKDLPNQLRVSGRHLPE